MADANPIPKNAMTYIAPLYKEIEVLGEQTKKGIEDLDTKVSELDSKFEALNAFVIKNVRVGPSGSAGKRSKKKRHSKKKRSHRRRR